MSQASVGQGVSSESTDCMRGFCAAAWTCPQYEDGMGSEGRCRQRTRGFQRGPSREGHRAASWFSRGRREVWDILAFYEGFWRFLLCAVLSLVVFVNSEFSDVRSRCLYVLTLMVSCWLISSLSPYVVSLIPIVFFPLLKVESVGFVATSYMDSSSFLILGASMMVTALERAKLDVAVANALRSFAPSGTALLALYLMFVSFVSASCLTSIGTMLLICPVVEILRAKSQEQPAAALLSRAEDSGPGEGSFSPQAGEGEGAEQTVVTTADSSEEKLPSAASTQQNALFFRETLGSDSPVRVRGEAESQSLETGAGTARRRQQSLTEKPLKSSWPTTQGPELGDEAAAGGWLSLAKLEETSSSCLEMDSPKKKTDAPRDSGGLDGERPCCCLDSVAEESDLQRRSTQASAVCRNSPRFCCCPRCALNLNKAQPRGQPQLPRSLQDAGRLRDDHERLLLFMGCSFGATIGASLTLTSSGANAIFLSTLEALYGSLQPPQTNPVTFMTWMLLSIPVGTAQLLATWFTLVAAWLGPREALEASGVCLKALWLGLAGVCHSSYSAAINCLLARLLRRRASRSAKRGGGEAGAVAGEFEARRLEASAPSGEEGQTSSPSKAQPVVTKTFEAKTRSLVSSERASPSAPGPCFMARSYVVGSWVLLALLWITRRTVIPAIPGWGTFFGNFVDDSWPAMAVPLSFFFVPLEARTKTSSIVRLASVLRSRSWESAKAFAEVAPAETETATAGEEVNGEEAAAAALHFLEGDVLAASRSSNTILTFPVVQETVDWGLLLLVGSGFALAAVTRKCGLQSQIAKQLIFLESLAPYASVACILAIASIATQLASGTSIASILIPLLSASCDSSRPNCPLAALLPTVMGIHLGFLLPISSSSNAIVVRYTKLKASDFFTRGLLVLVVCYAVTYGFLVTYANLVFKYL